MQPSSPYHNVRLKTCESDPPPASPKFLLCPQDSSP
jgi:hypothetical protein